MSVARAEQPTELWEGIGGPQGFLGAHIPESYGGSGGGLAERVYIVIEGGNSSTGLPNAVSCHFVHLCPHLRALRDRSDERGVAHGHGRW